MKLAVTAGFASKMLPYIKLIEDGDFCNLVEGVGRSFLTCVSVVDSGINACFFSHFPVFG